MSIMKARMTAFSSDITNPRSAGMLSGIVIGVVGDIRGGRVVSVELLTEKHSVLDFMKVGDFECNRNCVEMLCGAAHGRVINAIAKKNKVLDHIMKYPELLTIACVASQPITEHAIELVLTHFNELKPNAVFNQELATKYTQDIKQL